jgi:Icc-related predicted phosphoesterase
MARRLRRLLLAGPVNGATDALEQLLQEVSEDEIDLIALVGDLGAPWSKPDTFREIFRLLGEHGRPAYWIPGPTDAPLRQYLREAYNMEIAFEHLHGVHGTVALASPHVVVAGMGGEIVDDPDVIRGEEALLRYPGWEVEYRLKVVRELEELQRIFMFTTRPAHKGLGEEGSEVLAELIKTYRPRVAVVGGDSPAEETLGTTLVVSAGRLDRGHYAIVDLGGPTAEARKMAGRPAEQAPA